MSRLVGLKHVLLQPEAEPILFALIILTSMESGLTPNRLFAKCDLIDSRLQLLDPEPLVEWFEKRLEGNNFLENYRIADRPWF